MPSTPATHPSPQQLAAFAGGKLGDAEARAVAAHLGGCPDCRRAAAAAPGATSATLAGPSASGSRPAPNLVQTQLPGATVPPAGAASPPPAELPPELAHHPRYRILAELGRGGMGVVYKAEQTLMDRLVAVKVISKELLSHPGALERFAREVRSAARLNHPNIVIAHDAEQVGDLHMLVMEYVEGQSLERVLHKKGPMQIGHACFFVRQAALGLQHAFDHGMVHRDIKPQNLMVTAKGQVKILDFGLAKVVSENSQQSALTATSSYMGTPDYSAPEQAKDARSADIRADIYSLGCTLYCLLAGRPPFQADTAILTILAHLEQAPQPLTELRPDVPAELWAVVERMLAKDPARRYQKPAEVAPALLPFCKGGTKVAVEAPAPAPAPPAPRPKQPAAKGTKTTAVEAPFQPLAEKPAKSPKPTKKGPEPAKAKRGLLMAGVAAGLLLFVVVGALVAFAVLSRDKTQALAPTQPQTSKRPEPLAAATPREPAAITTPPAEPPVAVVPPDSGSPPSHASGGGFVPLFNGRNLDGWSVDTGDPRTWAVDDGAIVCHGTDVRTRNYLLSNLDYGDFVLRLEYSLDPNGEGGVAVRAVKGENLPYGNNRIPDHPLFKLVASPGGQETGMTFWIVDRTRVKPDRTVEQLPTGTWNRLEMEVRGRTFRASVNDQPVCNATLAADARFSDGTVPALNRRKGRIGFQKHTGTVRFRNIEIKELSPAPPDEPSHGPRPVVSVTLEPAAGFVPLFNGKDLSGWKTYGGGTGDWRVQDGAIVSAGPHSYLFTEQGNFRNIHLRAEAMINDGGNSGLLFRVPYVAGLPRGYEAQIDSTHRDPVKTGSLHPSFNAQLTPEERAKVSVLDMLVRPNQWFTQEVIAFGDHIVIKVNGKTTVDYVDRYSTHAMGHIALQQLEPTTVVKFRKIEVKELDRDPASPDPAAETDPARENLDRAWAAYGAEMTQYRQAVEALLDKREDDARKTATRVQVDRIKAHRDAFERRGEHPPAEPADLREKRLAARGALEKALRAAIDDYTKARKDREAAALEHDWKELRREDLFPFGKYQGTLRNGARNTTDLHPNYTFTRTHPNGNTVGGSVEFNNGTLIFRNKDFVEVWAYVSGKIVFEHWAPPNTYPGKRPRAAGEVAFAHE